MESVKVVIADDDERFRWRVGQFLASELSVEIVGEAATGHEAVTCVRELRPDIVLMDVRMPGLNGVSATRALKEEMPDLKVIVLSVYDLEEYRDAALASGASAYVVKKSMIEELIPAMKCATQTSSPSTSHVVASGESLT
jgi:DNA-binding NarL/FixJ family response regulator